MFLVFFVETESNSMRPMDKSITQLFKLSLNRELRQQVKQKQTNKGIVCYGCYP